MTARIFIKLIIGVVCVLVVALAAADLLVSKLAEDTYLNERRRDLTEKIHMLAELSPNGFADVPRARFKELAHQAGLRITVIAPDGRVLADSSAEPSEMENHATRPEVVAALAGEEGSSMRMSPTLGVQSLYIATPIPAGALRVAVPLADIHDQITAIRKEMLTSMVYAFIPAMLVAAVFARLVSSRLGAIIEYAGRLTDGGYRHRLNWQGRDEMGLLAQKLDETAEKLESTFDQLEREHAELERLEQIRKDFVINVSHELRTPLASIQGYAETLLNGALYDTENNLKFVSIIKRNAERLANLTSDLLTLSRIELKLQKFQFASHRVNEIIGDCLDCMRPLAERKQIAIEAELASEDAEVFSDSEAVHQALRNLLDNAVKYAPQGGRIRVSARVLETGPGTPPFIEIAVHDNGPGIPQDDLARLFERFYRVDKARSRELGGTGLGLAIVKHIAKAHGGAVRVESEPGQGATFAFTMPMEDIGVGREVEVKSVLTVS